MPATPDRPPQHAVGRWWLDTSLRTKGLIVLAIPMVTLVALGVSNLMLSTKLDALFSASSASSNSISVVNQRLQVVLDAETSVRGYVATGNPAFLAPYDAAIKELAPIVRSHQTTGGITGAQSRTLQELGLREFAILATLRAGTASGSLRAGVLDKMLLEDQATVDHLRSTVASIQARQRGSLARRQQQVASWEDASRDISIAGLSVGIAAGILAMLLFIHGISRRVAAVRRNTDRFIAGQPLEPITPSADEIGLLEADLLEAADLLEQRERELHSARDEAVAATRAKDQFLSRISHELRTPLTAVLGFGQLLQFENLSPDDADSVNHIVAAGEHLLALINDVLDIARIETGNLSLSLEPILLSEVVEESVSLMRPLADEHRVTTEVRDLDGLAVQADRQRLKQVLINLVSNAIKYNREGGSIVVSSVSTSDGTVTVEVTDTGVGIDEKNLQRLFQPFERLGAEQSGIEGVGVGLSLCRSLTEAMHGSIEASSELGEGSTFSVTLPAATVAAPTDRRDRGGGEPKDRSVTVIYAEDNLATLRVVERVFERRPETLEVALQGRMILNLARELRPRLILLDLHLPDLSGEEVLRQLKADRATASVPVVILSADATPGRLERLLDEGAAACLPKPLNVADLIAILDRLP